MTKPVSIPNTFATQTGNIPLSQLDQNFLALQTAVNDPTTYANYAIDTGAVNVAVVTLNPAPASLASLIGIPIQFLPVATSTGAATINVNAFGAKNITRANGGASQAGDLQNGIVTTLIYNGASFTIQGQVLGGTNTWTLPQIGTVTTDNDGSFDMTVTNNFKCTPTGTFALTFTNITAGQSGYVLLVNTSGYAVTAAATTKVNTTFLTTVSTAGTYLVSYFTDGTNVYVTTGGAMA